MEKARAANENSGAQSGAKVAEYLRGGIEAKPTGEKVLEKLALPQAVPAAIKPVTEPSGPNVDDSKLAALSQPTAPTKPAEPVAPESTATKPVDLSKADEKLSSLLGGKK